MINKINIKETIAAIATAQGIGALAVIRISGQEAFKIFEKIIKEESIFKDAKQNSARLYTIINKEKNEIIDEVISIKYCNPKSYTGEDTIEIISHGGNFTVKKIIEEIIRNGARIAQKGEFTKRAFLNGKIDLLKAESIRALIESKNEIEYTIAIDAYKGKNLKEINKIEEKIKNEICYIEAEIEFGEEEKYQRDANEIKKIKNMLKEEINRAEKIESKKNGINITIAGPTNAGKSSLINYLLGYERAIVHEKHGTTRDKISEKVEIDGKEVNIIDTAGLRTTDDEIEKIGQELTEKSINEANIIVWVTDCSEDINEEEKCWLNKLKRNNLIIIFNKCDNKKNINKEQYYIRNSFEINRISLKKKIKTKEIVQKIHNQVNKVFSEHKLPSIIINKRQNENTKKLLSNIEIAIKSWNQKEIAAYHLNECIKIIEETSGKTSKEEIYNKIFNKFCIGK